MRKIFLTALSLLPLSFIFAQQPELFHSGPDNASRISVIQSGGDVTVLEFTLGSVFARSVAGEGMVFTLDNSVQLQQAGAPDLPKLTGSLIIPNLAGMQIEVLSSEYDVYTGVETAPSKGVISRTEDPASLPYLHNAAYQQDAFFPGTEAALQTPYILRDFRGQVVAFHPLQYNPVSKELRVYNRIRVRVSVQSELGENPLLLNSGASFIDREMDHVYQDRFLNYTDASRYMPIEESGSMLIISAPAFSGAMESFIDWKIQRGIKTEMVTTDSTGTSSAEIKSFVQQYYTVHPDLKFLLLVGDAAQIPPQDPDMSNGLGGPSDNFYGYLTGNDAYPEIFVGRFSAQTVAHVQTQVERSLTYEKNPAIGNWYGKGIGIASNEGPGDDNQMDYEHERALRTILLGFTYTQVDEFYDGSQGGADAPGDPTQGLIVTAINEGRGVINYTGHGSNSDWVTSGFNNSNISALDNAGKLPFVWSVGCVNGEFMNTTCFAEYWLRSKNGSGQPVGAVATLMSTINQYWNEPMEGQDHMIDLLTGSVAGNIKRSFGGISMNGCMKMNDAYSSSGDDMTDTWALFGDPSLMIRTAQPQAMTVTHVNAVPAEVTSITVNCDVEGALICITRGREILGTGTVSSGVATITLTAALNVGDNLTVTATAFNYVPYQGTITVYDNTGLVECYAPGLMLYPNPATDWLFVNFTTADAGNARWAICDLNGKLVLQSAAGIIINPGLNYMNIPVTALAEGTYNLTVWTGDQPHRMNFIKISR